MKSTATILFLLSVTYCAAQFTIPNGDFESWEFNGWNHSPTSWTTGNSHLTQDTFQDSLPYSGVLAMRVEPQPTGLGEEGEASIQIPTGAIPPSLDFWVKYERTLTTYLGVTIEFYNQESLFYSETWQAEDTLSDWTFVSLALDQIEPVMTHAVIRVQAIIGDLAPGEGWIAIDDMSVGGLVDGLPQEERRSIQVYPNPASEVLHLELEENVLAAGRIRLIDQAGKVLIDRPADNRVGLGGLSRGQYILEVILRGEVIATERLMIDHH